MLARPPLTTLTVTADPAQVNWADSFVGCCTWIVSAKTVSKCPKHCPLYERESDGGGLLFLFLFLTLQASMS